jgi:hypothetical protein
MGYRWGVFVSVCVYPVSCVRVFTDTVTVCVAVLLFWMKLVWTHTNNVSEKWCQPYTPA